MIITIGGTAGSGKNFVGEELAKRIDMKLYCAGDIRREMAKSRGITLEELNKIGEKEDWTDKEADQIIIEKGKHEDNFIFIGRLAFHFIPKSVKIFLDAKLSVRADRIFRSFRPEETFENINHAMIKIQEREASDRKRYKKYYGIDFSDKKNFDLIIDTSYKDREEIIKEILDFIKKKKKTIKK